MLGILELFILKYLDQCQKIMIQQHQKYSDIVLNKTSQQFSNIVHQKKKVGE